MAKNDGNIRVHKPAKNFEQVSGTLIRDLDATTIGVYCKLLKFGESWKMSIKGLAKVLELSPAKVRAAICSLEAAGYIVRTPQQGEGGKLSGWIYEVYGNCVPEDDRSCAGMSSDGSTVLSKIRNTDEPTTRSTDNTENDEDIIYIPERNNIPVKNNILTPPHNACAREDVPALQEEFRAAVSDYADLYPAAMIEAFCDYWSAPLQRPTKSQQKAGILLKWQTCDTWDLAARLRTWNRKDQESKSARAARQGSAQHSYGPRVDRNGDTPAVASYKAAMESFSRIGKTTAEREMEMIGGPYDD